MSDYGSWTTSRLRAKLLTIGASSSGRKTDLVERLEAYDRNNNFASGTVNLPAPVLLPRWPTSGFKQLLSKDRDDFPTTTLSQIKGYFAYRMVNDGQSAGDIKALEKGNALLESGRITACSFYKTADDTFLTGIIRAAMKKKISYNVRLRLSTRVGEVFNKHCECPSGKGPHGTCKHLAAVLLMLQIFKENGDLSVEKSCTEQLQTFHAPKTKYDGSPIKAIDLPRKRVVDMSDPRPVKYRNNPGYNSHVRNRVLNYCSLTGKNLTARQLYEKADIQTATKDHDYLDKPFTEYWVEREVVVNIDKADVIEKATRKQSATLLWFDEREWRITASTFGDICKMTDRRDKAKLCQSLLSSNQVTVPSVVHGKQYESIAINKFEIQTGMTVTPAGLHISIDHPFLAATPDGVIDSDHIVEVKCPFSGRYCEILPGNLFPFLEYDINKEKHLKQTHNYYIQVQGQLYITKRRFCYFVVFTFEDLFVEKIEIDTMYCETCIIPKLEYFYSKYFRKYIAERL